MQANVSVRKPIRFVLLALALAGILFLVASPSNVADAKPSAAVYGGHCYRYVTTTANFATALATAPTLPSPDAACLGSTGYLVVINNAGENAFVLSLATAGDPWLGGNDATTEGTFKWVSLPGSPTFCTGPASNCPAQPGWYVNWEIGEPNASNPSEDYLMMITAGPGAGRWNDIGDGPRTYVVEYDPAPAPVPVPAQPSEVPEADTLLLLGGGMSGLGVWLRWQWSKRRGRSV